MRRTLLVVAVLVVAATAAGQAAAFSKLPVSIPGAGGTPLAGTLYLPSGAPPAGGWPALVLLRGPSTAGCARGGTSPTAASAHSASPTAEAPC